jgi:hypothetical protein
MEMRNSVAAVNSDPINVPILLPIDPWYTATVYGSEMNEWIDRSEITSAYLFSEEQKVIVTSLMNNRHAQDTPTAQTEAASVAGPQDIGWDAREPFYQFTYLDPEGLPKADNSEQILSGLPHAEAEPAGDLLVALEDLTHAVVLLFRGAYPLTPFSLDKQTRTLPWAQKYLPGCTDLPALTEVNIELNKDLPSIKSDIESVAAELNKVWDGMNQSGEFGSPLTYYSPPLVAHRERCVQGLAVEALGLIDNVYAMLSAARHIEAARILADAFSFFALITAEAQDIATEIEGTHSSLEAMRKGASKGGLRSGETRRLNSPLPSRQELRSERDKLIRAGRASRDIASIFSQRYGRTADYIRKLLREA